MERSFTFSPRVRRKTLLGALRSRLNPVYVIAGGPLPGKILSEKRTHSVTLSKIIFIRGARVWSLSLGVNEERSQGMVPQTILPVDSSCQLPSHENIAFNTAHTHQLDLSIGLGGSRKF